MRTFTIQGKELTITSTDDSSSGNTNMEFHLVETGELLPMNATMETNMFAGVITDAVGETITGFTPVITEYLQSKNII
jgi:hypothetical protein